MNARACDRKPRNFVSSSRMEQEVIGDREQPLCKLTKFQERTIGFSLSQFEPIYSVPWPVAQLNSGVDAAAFGALRGFVGACCYSMYVRL